MSDLLRESLSNLDELLVRTAAMLLELRCVRSQVHDEGPKEVSQVPRLPVVEDSARRLEAPKLRWPSG